MRIIRATTRGAGAQGIIVAGARDLGATSILAEIAEQARRSGCRVAFAASSDSSARSADRYGQDYAAPPFSTLMSALTSGPEPAVSHADFGDLGQLYDRPLWLVDRLAELLEPVLRVTPLIIAIDDASFADGASIFAVRTLASRFADRPILWLLGTRPGRTQELVCALGSLPTEILDLEALTSEAMAEIARDRDVGCEANIHRLIMAAGGRPSLFVRVLDELADSEPEALSCEPGLPPAFMSWLQDRLLWEQSAEQFELMRTMSVLETATLPVLSRLTRRDVREVLSDLRVLLEQGYVTEQEEGLTLACPIVRDAIYAGLSFSERQLLHCEAADLLRELGRMALEVAPHIAATAEVGDGQAVGLIRAAAAEVSDQPDKATALLRQARALCDPSSTLCSETTAELGEALVRGQRYEVALGELDALEQGLSDARLVAAIAPAMWACGRRDELTNVVATHLADEADLDPGTSTVLRSIMAAEAARAGGFLVPRLSVDVSGNPAASAWLARAHGYEAHARGDFAAASAAFHVGAHVDGGWSLEALDATLDTLDDTTIRELDAWGAAPSPDGRAAVRLIGRARIALVQGRLADAQADARAADAIGQQEGSVHIAPLAASVQASVALLEGRTGDAQRLLARHNSSAGDGLGELTVVARALSAAVSGDLDAAVRLVAEGLTRWPQVFRRMDNLAVAVRVGSLAKDEALLERVVALANASAVSGNPLAVLVATYAAGVRDGDEELIRHAADLIRFVHRPVLVASIAEHLGVALLQSGNRTAAIHVLDRSWDAFHGVGATGSAQRVRRQLVALGIRRRRWGSEPARPTGGWEALTGSERRVTLLAAEGLSNREVATRLTVSPNTVATHLRSAYAKLGVSKRVQLARLVLERSPDSAVTESG